MKIRIGNDFKTKWAITWLGEPEDFSDATDISLSFNIYDKKIELTKDVDYTITDNIIEIDVTPDICNILGVYNLELHYTKPNADFIDGERRSAVDIDAFRIVGKSDKADATQDVSIISDAVAIFLDIAYKKLEEIEANEDVRITNEGEREDAEDIRVANEDIRISNEQDRQINTTTVISNAEQATLNANNSAVYANEQGSYAEEMSLHPPTIINDYWHNWNFTTNQYESTGQYARGDSAIDGALVVQEKGQSAVNTMSQKAITDEFVQLADDVNDEMTLIKNNTYISVKNRVINGDFRKSTENWIGLNTVLSASNNILIGTGNVYNVPVSNINVRQETAVPFTFGRNVYVKASIRITDPDCTGVHLSFRNSEGTLGNYRQEISVTPIQGEWNLLEAILSVPTSGVVETATSKIVANAIYPSDVITGGKTIEVKNVMLLDLSSDFDVIPNLSDIQNLLSVYENEWFDGMVPQKTLKEVYDELISKLNMENTNMENTSMNAIMKQPKGTLQDWKKIEGTNSSDPYVVSPDGYLYFRQSSKIKRIKDIENGTIEEGISWTTPGLVAMFALPSGLIFVVNSGESPNRSIDVYKTSDFTVEPILKASFPGRHASGIFANSATYYGSNEILFIGVYDEVKGVMQADMHMSNDGGETFTKIKTTSGVDPNVNWHWHASHYDPYMGRIWISEGDGALGRGVWYSDDMGVTWQRIESNEYQPTLITSFPNRVIFGRDGGKPGIYEWKRSKKLEDYGPITELDDALTFRPDLVGQNTFPYSPYYNDGMEAYIMFTPTTSPATMYYMFATGDGGESWHCVFSGLNGFRGPIKKDKFVVCRAREWGDFALWYCPALEWE